MEVSWHEESCDRHNLPTKHHLVSVEFEELEDGTTTVSFIFGHPSGCYTDVYGCIFDDTPTEEILEAFGDSEEHPNNRSEYLCEIKWNENFVNNWSHYGTEYEPEVVIIGEVEFSS